MDNASNKGRLPPLILLLALLVATGVGWFLRRAATDAALDAAPRSDLGRDLEKDRRIAELEQQLAELRRIQARPAPATLAARQPVPGPNPTDAQTATPAPSPDTSPAGVWLRRLFPERFAALTPAALHALAELDLRGAEFADADLAHVADLPSLTTLHLRGTAVTDAGVVKLAATRLQTLALRGTQVTEANLSSLPATLRHLDLTDTRAGVDTCRLLRPLPDLHTLDLNRLPLTDASLEALPPLPSLRHIELDGTRVTEQGVRRLLERFPSLQRIEARHLDLAAETRAELARRFPDLEVVSAGDAARGPR